MLAKSTPSYFEGGVLKSIQPRTIMKRLLVYVLLSLTAASASASSGVIRFVGALVEPTCVAGGISRSAVSKPASVLLTECREPSLQMVANSKVFLASGIFSGALKDIQISPRLAAITGQPVVKELVISYQ